MTTPTDVIIVARTWVKTPWQHQARCKGVGTDCIGLIGGVGLECGLPEAKSWVEDQSLKGYGLTPDPDMLIAACDKYLVRVEDMTTVQLADILVMRIKRAPQHFAFVSELDPMYMVHAYASVPAVAENRVDVVWRSRILRIYRFPGLTYG